MRRCLLLLALILLAAPVRAETARITYLTSKSLYVDAGEQAGLRVDAMIDVLRDGLVIGQARVREVSPTRAVCEWTGDASLPRVGDEVRFTPAAPAGAATASGASAWERLGVHGRIGLQTLHLRDRSGYGADFDQPALTLRLHGERVGGSPLGVEADVRGRMLYRDDESSSRSRVYRLNVSGPAGADGLGWTAGRQFAPSLSVIHLFDGVRLEYETEHWATGILGGTQPDPKNLDLSADVVEGGAWATWRRTESRTRWSATVAAVGAYENGSIDREFAWLQGRVARGPVSVRLDQVLDLNRGWKQDAGESLISSTSTYLMTRWQVHPAYSVDAGLDTRRRVRFYRDRETPETAFDDTYRQGYWAGVRGRPLRWFDFSVRGRTRLRTGMDRADSADLLLGFTDRWYSGIRLDSRSSVYRSELVTGWLQTLRLSAQLHRRVSAGVFGGARHEEGRSNDLMDGTDPWYGVDVDVTLPHAVWMSLSFESTPDGEEAYDQLWFGTGLRF